MHKIPLLLVGHNAADHYDGITYRTYNRRKKGNCAYSLHDTNKWIMKNGRKKIAIGKNIT